MASKVMRWTATIALGLALMGGAKGVDDSQTINITKKNNTPKAVEGKMASADKPISREFKINTEGVIDKVPVITTDRGPGWVIKEGGKGYPNVTVGNTPKETGSAMAPGPYNLDVKGVSRLIGGKGTGDPTYEWKASENYQIAKVAIVKVPQYLYANATFYVPVTVVIENFPQLWINDQDPKQLFFTDASNHQNYPIWLNQLSVRAANGSSIDFSTSWLDVYIEPGTAPKITKITFWVSLITAAKQFKSIANTHAEWTVGLSCIYSGKKIDLAGKSHGTDGVTKCLYSQDIPVVEMEKSSTKAVIHTSNWKNTWSEKTGDKYVIYLASDGDYANLKDHEGGKPNIMDAKDNVADIKDSQADNLKVKFPLMSPQKIDADTLTYLSQVGIDAVYCDTRGDMGEVSCSAEIRNDNWGLSNEETIMIVAGQSLVSHCFSVSYRSKPTPNAKLPGMDLDDINGELTFAAQYFPAPSIRIADCSNSKKDVAMGLISATVAVGAAIVAPLAATSLAGVTAGEIADAVISGISSAAVTQFMDYWLKDNVINAGQGGNGGNIKYKDAYADIATSFVMRKVDDEPKSATVVFDAPYVVVDAISAGNNPTHFNMATNPSVKVGDSIELEASCSSRAYITTHVLDGSKAAGVFSMENVSEWLLSFKIK